MIYYNPKHRDGDQIEIKDFNDNRKWSPTSTCFEWKIFPPMCLQVSEYLEYNDPRGKRNDSVNSVRIAIVIGKNRAFPTTCTSTPGFSRSKTRESITLSFLEKASRRKTVNTRQFEIHHFAGLQNYNHTL
eukprot:scaffold41256_cov145-Amphora_coffeaeformis.AAC.2